MLAHILLATALAPAETRADGTAEPGAECGALLDASLEAMVSRPPLKEEIATAVMWIRMDARRALDAGDVDLCLTLARRVVGLAQPR